ncbi:MAG: IS200/IS605 family element transposase accessory protein TnpB [Dolichospermum sp. JUN01]|nr:IS200/IS605 family element transposase accessory protein TnpB [Dolichospermum sp. JUN01]MBS9395241.1 transposase [Dolichospermum sp. OL01]MCO5798869.1 IS200/IS605 family element transposase accessory protein TnpB [Dolichospermum sp. OL03]MCS6281805.1 IS200/IS605 family element transposase accessory protein TnpB [Dolichospermum sp.]QSV60268.1 MAG: IS200/IS605 family element transposase accessory protein TnpB [Dolichospermum sp. LBC05a]
MGVQQVLLSPDHETKAVLNYLCQQSGKLYNSGIYFARQTFFKTGKLLTSKFDLAYEPSVSKTMVAQSIPSTPAQQTLLSVIEAFKSFKELRSLFLKGQLHFKPKVPGYLTGSKLFKVAYPNSGGQKPILVNGQLRFSLGLTIKRWFGLSEFFLPMPSNLDIAKVKEFTILPKNGAFYLEMSYEVEKRKHDLDINQALSIDLGTADNLAACVDTLGNSLLIDARAMKAMNQLWNKKVSTRKEGKPEAYWDNWLDCVTRKRNHQMRDGINKAAKLIIDHCLKYGIGTLVIGWNEGFKSNASMGRINNQKFVQMPLGKLKDRLKQLCDLHGIRFQETEEAYTSKASFLDGDSLPKYGEKPEGWKASGKRVKRGLYQSANGLIVNADLNGSANILRKVASNLSLDLGLLGRRCLTNAARIRLWVLPNLILSAESQWL